MSNKTRLFWNFVGAVSSAAGVLVGLWIGGLIFPRKDPSITVAVTEEPAPATPKRYPTSTEARDCINAIPTRISADELGKRIDKCVGAR